MPTCTHQFVPPVIVGLLVNTHYEANHIMFYSNTIQPLDYMLTYGISNPFQPDSGKPGFSQNNLLFYWIKFMFINVGHKNKIAN